MSETVVTELFHRFVGAKRHLRCGLLLVLVGLSVIARNNKKAVGTVPVPPFHDGGIMSLWYREHKFIQNEFGDFELLNYDNCGFDVEKDSLAADGWKLVALGNFLGEKGVQYATLARVSNQSKGLLLVMFEWVDPADGTKPHGVFYHTFVGQETLLIRTKQAAEGGVDTLEFSCSDMSRICGKAYYNAAADEFSLGVVDKD
ncbi:MAG: hypothetical protein GF344_08525 [Chitinivibrionales bacterium]|nr:hypothetical protein [Chitinivibrionales bacterium]MBD3356922.1 hypothetical protein [Chitinivibrionales bacterium]